MWAVSRRTWAEKQSLMALLYRDFIYLRENVPYRPHQRSALGQPTHHRQSIGSRKLQCGVPVDDGHDPAPKLPVMVYKLIAAGRVDQLPGFGVKVDQDQVGAVDQGAWLAAQPDAAVVGAARTGADHDLDAIILKPFRQVRSKPCVL
jgi:hypothetical protein